MKMIAAFVVLLACGASKLLFAEGGNDRTPVSVDLVGDDGLTQALAHDLEEAVDKSVKVRLVSRPEESVISIKSDANVQPDNLGGKAVLIYSVRITAAERGTVPLTGVCYERAISKCVVEIMRVVEIQANEDVH